MTSCRVHLMFLKLTHAGLTVKFNFNCIMIDKHGIHQVDLSLDDPIAAIEAKVAAAEEKAAQIAAQDQARGEVPGVL